MSTATIKLKALRVFVTVAEIGNIRDAATKLARSPSAVSMALTQLERNIRATLFERDRKSALTPVGRFTLETARAQLTGFERCVRSIYAFARNEVGRLSIAWVPSVAQTLMPDLIGCFVASGSARPPRCR